MERGIFTLNASLLAGASVVGYKEYEGPLGDRFDFYNDRKNDGDYFGQKSYEAAESEMQRMALGAVLDKTTLTQEQLDVMFAGDLQNQCTGAAYGLLSYPVPYFGLYGACSTMAEGLLLGAMTVSGGFARHCATVASSHNCSAERQYRTPLNYGGQRTPTAQWTVTGAAAFVVSEPRTDRVRIVRGAVGITRDLGINDTNNMGAAMAPAAADTLCRFFRATDTQPSDYDVIVTGDLGTEGGAILCDLMRLERYELAPVYDDCGMRIYNNEAQDTHAGGSGCGCSAVVLAAHFLPLLQSGSIRRMLILGTGAMMSPDRIKQGENIPGIAHLLELVAPDAVPPENIR